MPRHRILEFRGNNADAWIRELDKHGDDAEAYIRYIVIGHGKFYKAAPEPRGPITIPRASVTREVEIDGRTFSLTVCREPKFLLLEEVRN